MWDLHGAYPQRAQTRIIVFWKMGFQLRMLVHLSVHTFKFGLHCSHRQTYILENRSTVFYSHERKVFYHSILIYNVIIKYTGMISMWYKYVYLITRSIIITNMRPHRDYTSRNSDHLDLFNDIINMVTSVTDWIAAVWIQFSIA